MKWLRWILWEQSHLEKENQQIRSDFYLLSQRINLLEKSEKRIMDEMNKLKAQIVAIQASTNAAIARVEARLSMHSALPAELDAMTSELATSTAALDALLADKGGSMGGITE